MDEYKIKQIIEKLLNNQAKKRVFLILDKSDVYIDEVYILLSKYEDIQYNYIESDLSTECSELDKIRNIGNKLNTTYEIEDFIEKSDLILIPFLTKNTLAKVSLGIADDILTNYIQLAIMKNKNIIALDSSWNPNSENSKIKKINLNNAYNNMLLNYYNIIKTFGVKSIPIYELDEQMQNVLYYSNIQIENNNVNNENFDKKHITKKDIEGKDILHINKNSKLTHLAKEYIVENNISVVEDK